MFDVVDFMERMGGDAQLSQASDSELAEALAATDIASELQSVVLAKDSARLEALLGRKPACMLVAPPHPPGPPGFEPLHAPFPATPPPPPLPEEEWEQYQRER